MMESGAAEISSLSASESSDIDSPDILGKAFSDSQRQQIKALFESIKGANPETGKAILENLVKNGGSLDHREKKEIAKSLGIAESTVGRYLGTKNTSGLVSKLDRDVLEDILRWDVLRVTVQTKKPTQKRRRKRKKSKKK